MTPAEMARLFEPFYRVRSGPSGQPGGHRAWAWRSAGASPGASAATSPCESTPGEGSTFTLSIPSGSPREIEEPRTGGDPRGHRRVGGTALRRRPAPRPDPGDRRQRGQSATDRPPLDPGRRRGGHGLNGKEALDRAAEAAPSGPPLRCRDHGHADAGPRRLRGRPAAPRPRLHRPDHRRHRIRHERGPGGVPAAGLRRLRQQTDRVGSILRQVDAHAGPEAHGIGLIRRSESHSHQSTSLPSGRSIAAKVHNRIAAGMARAAAVDRPARTILQSAGGGAANRELHRRRQGKRLRGRQYDFIERRLPIIDV